MSSRHSSRVCEIHIPISPTPSFTTQVRYLATSIRRFGGPLCDCPIIVTVGGPDPFDLASQNPWSRELGVEWRWLADPIWRRHGIYATALERFCHPIDADAGLFLDADTILLAPVDEQLDAAREDPAVRGLPAHIAPFGVNEENSWQRLFSAVGLGKPPLTCEQSGWGCMEHDPNRRFCPPYFNLGVLLISRRALDALGPRLYEEMERVTAVYPTVFRCQLALTAAIVRANIPWRPLALRFNFPNDTRFLPRHRAELDDVRIIHYLREEELSRRSDFESVEAVGELLRRGGMNAVNQRFLSGLCRVHELVLAAG